MDFKTRESLYTPFESNENLYPFNGPITTVDPVRNKPEAVNVFVLPELFVQTVSNDGIEVAKSPTFDLVELGRVSSIREKITFPPPRLFM